MFTGIIKDIGTITAVKRRNGGIRFRVGYGNADVFSGLSIDESVSLNGACQTVVALGDGWFEVESVEETLSPKQRLAPFATALRSISNGLSGLSTVSAAILCSVMSTVRQPCTT